MKHVDPTALEADARAKWSGDADLRAEFMSDFSLYFAYRKAEARGGARRTTGRVTTPAPNRQAASAETTRAPARTDGDQVDQEARSAWDTDPKIRAEFLSAENYAAFLKADRAGCVKILGAPRPRQASTAVAGPSPAYTRPAAASTQAAPTADQAKALSKEKIKTAALSRFALTWPEITAALIAEDRNPSAPVPTGKLDGQETLAEFKAEYPDIAAALIAADRETRKGER